jgi:hypothetical protein
MRKFNLLLIIFLIVGIITAFYLWNKDNVELKPLIVNRESLDESSNKPAIHKDSLSLKEKLKQNKLNATQIKQLLVNRVQAFNPDPAIDAELIKLNLEHCIKLLNPDKYSRYSKKNKSKNNRSETQIQYSQDLAAYCEGVNSKHPEYMLTNEDDIKILRDSLNTDNETGKILSKFYNDKNIDQDTFDIASKIQHLKEVDPNLLLSSGAYFNRFLVGKLKYDVSDLIKSKDNSYVQMVRRSAINLYACEAGARCDRLSLIMSSLCIYRNVCGKDYNDVIYNKMSEGIRLDILLVYKHLKKLFD